MKTVDEILEKISDAEMDVKESRGLDMNSYGAGWDSGYLAALRWIMEDEE